MDNRLNDAVIRATNEVFTDMLALKISHEDPIELPLNHTKGVCSDITVIISFVGEISGALMLKCSRSAGSQTAARMLGMDVEADSDEMKDALGELLNIIIGSAKSYYSQDNTFRMSVPTTIIGQSYSLYIKANTGRNVSFILFRSGTAKIGIEVYLKEKE